MFATGGLIGPAHLGVLASLGSSAVRVAPPVRVGVLATGDELVDAPVRSGPGRSTTRIVTPCSPQCAASAASRSTGHRRRRRGGDRRGARGGERSLRRGADQRWGERRRGRSPQVGVGPMLGRVRAVDGGAHQAGQAVRPRASLPRGCRCCAFPATRSPRSSCSSCSPRPCCDASPVIPVRFPCRSAGTVENRSDAPSTASCTCGCRGAPRRRRRVRGTSDRRDGLAPAARTGLGQRPGDAARRCGRAGAASRCAVLLLGPVGVDGRQWAPTPITGGTVTPVTIRARPSHPVDRVMPTEGPLVDRYGACTATCACRSPTGATSAACTAWPRT